MNIVVLVKQVPDSGSERNLRADDKTVDRASASNVINEMDEYAIEEALKIKEAHGGEVTILTMGPASATESIRKALSMGPDKAVHVLDDALHGSCALGTSKVLAAALAHARRRHRRLPAPSRPTAGSRSCRRCSPSGSGIAARHRRAQAHRSTGDAR